LIKILVTGSTKWEDKSTIEKELSLLKDEFTNILIVHGNEPGAESITEEISTDLGIGTLIVSADYAEYQDLAISKRNETLIKNYDPHLLYCFANEIEKEPILKDLLKEAQERAIITKVIEQE